MRRVGFLVNPIAGMGGRVGLKGTDGKVREARERGAKPRAPDRAARAVEAIPRTDPALELFVWDTPMGADVVDGVDLPISIAGGPDGVETTAADTRAAVRAFIEAEVDLILFAGGDGTAVDIVETLNATDANVPILGIPAGVKVFSSVFAVSPEAAGQITGSYERTERREVADLDEAAYREGHVRSELRGVVAVPVADTVQSGKQMASGNVEALVAGVLDDMRPDRTYLLGPGGTVGAVKEALEINGTPLGVDVVRDRTLVVSDAAAADLRAALDEPTAIVVSPIGGQGFVFGRGNDQFAPDVIRGSELQIIASREKLNDTGVLRVDTGDPELDDALRGWTRVRIGRVEHRMMEIV